MGAHPQKSPRTSPAYARQPVVTLSTYQDSPWLSWTHSMLVAFWFAAKGRWKGQSSKSRNGAPLWGEQRMIGDPPECCENLNPAPGAKQQTPERRTRALCRTAAGVPVLRLTPFVRNSKGIAATNNSKKANYHHTCTKHKALSGLMACSPQYGLGPRTLERRCPGRSHFASMGNMVGAAPDFRIFKVA